MVERLRNLIALLLCVSVLAACGDDDDDVNPDAMVGGPDASAGTPDAASDVDAAPTSDAPPTSPIQEARDSADGLVDILIDTALVTYKKPALGNDDAGFFIQAEQQGPALFIAVDPTTLTPEPAVGDDVTLRVTTMGTNAQLREATAISDFAVNSSGNDVNALLQDLTGLVNVSTQINSLESEIVTMTGDVAEDFGFAGTGHLSAQFDLSATADANFKLRVPETVQDQLDLVTGCNLTLAAVPMWRFNDQAQPSPYAVSDITVNSGCPAPEVTGAVAISPTEVKVSFSRHIDASSVLSDGSQFTITGGAGLTVSNAVVSGRDVTLTTSSQVGGEVYTVTVADTVQDTTGTGVSTSANTADFNGFVVLADVVISELNANISAGCDLIELQVLSGGSMDGFVLKERIFTLVTFSGLTVATGDVIVVHIDSTDATCNPGPSGNETAAVDELPAGTYPQNYDTAWDWYSDDTGITNTDNVITLYDNAANIVDAMLASNDPTGTAAADSETQASNVADAGEWEMVGGGVPAGGFIDDDFSAHAAQDLDGTGTDPSGESITRLAGADTNTKADWAQTASSWGALYCPAAAPTGGGGELVFESVDTVAGEVTIRNVSGGAITLDSNWQLCASFSYADVTTATLVAGSLALADGDTVTLGWGSIIATDTDLGIYDMTGGVDFTDSTKMRAFAQWGSSGHGRESVADTAGLWTAGDFIDLAGAPGFVATGDVTTSGGYTRAAAACLP